LTKKRAAAPAKQTKKQARELAAGKKKLLERAELMKRNAINKENKTQARRKQLILEGVTPRILDNDVSVENDDME
jgi:hypothetical protein